MNVAGHVSSASSSSWQKAAMTGAEAGAIATLSMSGVMYALQRSGMLGKMPPRLMVERLLARVGAKEELPQGWRTALSMLAHVGFGGSQGALYAMLLRWGSRTKSIPLTPSVVTSVPFALMVWVVSYAGWIPAIGIMKPPSQDRSGRPTSMVASHIVFGVVLALALRARSPSLLRSVDSPSPDSLSR